MGAGCPVHCQLQPAPAIYRGTQDDATTHQNQCMYDTLKLLHNCLVCYTTVAAVCCCRQHPLLPIYGQYCKALNFKLASAQPATPCWRFAVPLKPEEIKAHARISMHCKHLLLHTICCAPNFAQANKAKLPTGVATLEQRALPVQYS